MLLRMLAGLCCLAVCATVACGQGSRLPRFDFTDASEVQQWHPTHDIRSIEATPEGMAIHISGSDPYSVGPRRDYPSGVPLWLRIRLKSDDGGTAQIFYFTTGSTEENSVRFGVQAGEWQTLRVPLPALGPGYALRFDPPGTSGVCIVSSIEFEQRVLLKEPAWPKPTAPRITQVVRHASGPLAVRQSGARYGHFEVLVEGRRVAFGNTRPRIGYLHGGALKWVELKPQQGPAQAGVAVASARDADGALWRVEQRFASAKALPVGGAIDVTTTLRVDKTREVVFFAPLLLFAGVGQERNTGLLAGVEYLDKLDTSSSEADIIGPGSKRQVPDNLKLTFPLMAQEYDGRYVGITWKPDPRVCAVYDTPDRLFKSGGHVMGLLVPGSDGSNRVEGNLLPYGGMRLIAGQPLTHQATLLGGMGKSMVPAVQQYVARKGLPPLPRTGLPEADVVRLMAHGYLDSKIRQGALYRHAYWPGIEQFGPHPAADVALFLEWLARRSPAPDLAERLRKASAEAIAAVPANAHYHSGVSHVRYPAVPLAFRTTEEALTVARGAAEGALSRFEPDGSIPYRATPGQLDYGRTHWAKDANGLTAQVVVSALEAAIFCGDKALIGQALQRLSALDKFMNEAPRGAQTWEVPLHTPDILASAHLVRAYVLGYELTGDRNLLNSAVYWAWTGVPFTYLVNPTRHPVGLYATTPVLGATQWKAPNWIGLPVQWCGLVYADALYWLSRYDKSCDWRKLADGIALSGIQQSWQLDAEPDLRGLLPDSFDLRGQIRNPVAINPGTVLAPTIRMLKQEQIFDQRILRASGLTLIAPAAIEVSADRADGAVFRVQGWLDRSYEVLVHGAGEGAQVLVDGAPAGESMRRHSRSGAIILRLHGQQTVAVNLK